MVQKFRRIQNPEADCASDRGSMSALAVPGAMQNWPPWWERLHFERARPQSHHTSLLLLQNQIVIRLSPSMSLITQPHRDQPSFTVDPTAVQKYELSEDER